MDKTSVIRILIVDDHEMLRRGLAVFLRSFDDFILVGEAKSGVEALTVCQAVQPDVVLMDLMMPEMDGITATEALLKQFPDLKVIVLTSAKEEPLITKALQVGAAGYILKSVSSEELAQSIRQVYHGQRSISIEITEVLIHATARPTAPDFKLSDREYQVLKLIVEGKNNLEIAAQLMISRSTVKFHIRSILAKLGVRNRLEAVTLALQHHLVE